MDMLEGGRTLSLLSVVTPVLDEEGTVRACHARMCAALADIPFELIVVDDGSTDSTPLRLSAAPAAAPVAHVPRR